MSSFVSLLVTSEKSDKDDPDSGKPALFLYRLFSKIHDIIVFFYRWLEAGGL